MSEQIAGYILDNTGIEVLEERITDIFESYDNEDGDSIECFKEEIIMDIIVQDKFTGIDASSSQDGTIYDNGRIIGFLVVSTIDSTMIATFDVAAFTGSLSLNGEVLKAVSDRINEYNEK